ncbi:hypothetical protein NOS3756_19790 [Nostoc sp. NIES-3756]|uniref:hypothetical protein n=1 Tax=Nostoc sp. NIES-3756 TaxID=1751286 RepID=UPI000721FCCF|nr:hypothetical protein [Nostoc sp. NIES-3756]BAT53034.1 hypothetical protein NOS3756_19790 [Nostoc sp. NIES-3756]
MINALYCRPHRGTGRAISLREAASAYVLFAFEGMYLFIGNKSISVGIFGALASWLNHDQLNQSGGCNVV